MRNENPGMKVDGTLLIPASGWAWAYIVPGSPQPFLSPI